MRSLILEVMNYNNGRVRVIARFEASPEPPPGVNADITARYFDREFSIVEIGTISKPEVMGEDFIKEAALATGELKMPLYEMSTILRDAAEKLFKTNGSRKGL
jgi:hypothetical protein